ncbi:quinolinate synthase NadA [Anaerovorax odorimutans]|uniref:quinolinate synthase NadA n=1 Tax=Anaerovorax odorimutans TaxID=109327 RepID=UPI00041F269D|nr:quinolinate synthase NadA [Anaerovorax odorimutans]
MKDIIESIKELKNKRDAVILAHYYVNDSVQAIADYVGDSYYLSKLAVETPHETVLLCGVRFMGESVKILNPNKTVIMPDLSADCPMAHMVNEEKIKQVKNKFEDLAVVCYINSTAKIKALSNVCVTSSNALQIVKSLPQKNIFFIPDNNLGRYIAHLLPEKNFIFNEGFCHVHTKMNKDNVGKLKKLHPEAKVLVHPECTMDVIELADYVGSTSGIINYAKKNSDNSFIVCTEHGINYELKKENPEKQFYFTEEIPTCIDMKKITLKNIEEALKTMENKIELDEDLRIKAEKALKKMHELAE